jgi:crotonobetainyl-CoA:carnitine CoA-transferase CaiB-like acyl-CoA transferase
MRSMVIAMEDHRSSRFPELTRVSGGARAGAWTFRFVYPAKDGFVSIKFVFGSSVGRFTRRLMEWIHDEGFCDAATRDKDWIAYMMLLMTGAEPIEELERVKGVIAAFTATKTKAELLRAASERDVLIAPVTRIDEVVASEQLAARLLARRRTSRAQARVPLSARSSTARRSRSVSPARAHGRRAHPRDLRRKLGIDDTELARLREQGIV